MFPNIAGIPVSETALQEQIIGKRGLARVLGWMVQHSRPAMIKDTTSPEGYSWRTAIQGDAGFPDLVLAKEGRLIIAELKREGVMPIPAQSLWLDTLASVEVVEVYLWWPSDLEEIQLILTLGHVPNLIERQEFKSSWQKRRGE